MEFELHEDAEIQGFADLIDPRNADERRVILLSGKRASGRASLLRSALRRLRVDGIHVLYSQIDLDGYEPDLVSAEDYLSYLRSKGREERAPSAADAIAQRLGDRSLTAEQAALLAVAAGRDSESEQLAALAAEALDQAAVRWEQLAPDPVRAPVVLHLTDTSQTPALLRKVLTDLEVPGLVVVVSCDPIHGSRNASRQSSSARFELMPMDEGEIRSWVRERFGAEAAEHAPSVRQACGGWRELLGQLAQSVTTPDDWSALPTPTEFLDRATADCDEDRRQTLQAFLVHAALCGENVPVRSLLDYLGVSQGDADDWVDLIDETVGEDSEARLFAARFQHPGFPGELVYGFRDPAAAARLTLTLPVDSRSRMAQELTAWLFRHRPIASRGAARVLVQLCIEGEIGGDRVALERELAWWAADADADALRRLLVEDSTPREEIWMVVNAVQTVWPPLRTLAVLDAAHELGVAPPAEGALHTIRAGLLLKLSRFDDAGAAIEAALAGVGTDKLMESVLLEQRSQVGQALGRAPEAAADAQRCRSLRLELLSSGDQRVAPMLQAAARQLRESGNNDEAVVIENALAEHAPQKTS